MRLALTSSIWLFVPETLMATMMSNTRRLVRAAHAKASAGNNSSKEDQNAPE
jgi:hypothetical protein